MRPDNGTGTSHSRTICFNAAKEAKHSIQLPTIADLSMHVAKAYGVIQPGTSETSAVRATFLIDPEGMARAMLHYPMTNGRTVDKILRLVKELQTSDEHKVVTPEAWQPGEKVIMPPPAIVDEAAARAANADYKCTEWYFCKKAVRWLLMQSGPWQAGVCDTRKFYPRSVGSSPLVGTGVGRTCIVAVPPEHLIGLASSGGSVLSHGVIKARALLGVPAVAGAEGLRFGLKAGRSRKRMWLAMAIASGSIPQLRPPGPRPFPGLGPPPGGGDRKGIGRQDRKDFSFAKRPDAVQTTGT